MEVGLAIGAGDSDGLPPDAVRCLKSIGQWRGCQREIVIEPEVVFVLRCWRCRSRRRCRPWRHAGQRLNRFAKANAVEVLDEVEDFPALGAAAQVPDLFLNVDAESVASATSRTRADEFTPHPFETMAATLKLALDWNSLCFGGINHGNFPSKKMWRTAVVQTAVRHIASHGCKTVLAVSAAFGYIGITVCDSTARALPGAAGFLFPPRPTAPA